MMRLIWVLVAGGFLSGCDVFEELTAAQQPKVIEIVGGYRVQINGQPVAIAGTSQCQSDASRHDCIVVTPNTSVVEVLVGYPGQPRREAWTVKRVGEQKQLFRGDGSTVMVAD
ncbi:hypothetical protein [Aeromonas caviae]|uniref:hypothetical protein n=1 Tax=Aeromonas caviae TaxID=648 RepID=UPI001CC6CD3F|nr:hypothetical protein [Aeromonas caviae]GJA77580.1 hypothetical protein KAM354_28160 [Aeromonas caviae]HDT5889343.1 hypothetical protein [Aeromonas dhakensis]HEB4980342.1 hypothetical protein [Aeromonas dhakensis]